MDRDEGRTALGVLRVNRRGAIELRCARCVQATPGGVNALAVFEENEHFLVNPDPGRRFAKVHGVYESARVGAPLWAKSPAIGSRIRCHVCQWVTIVPDPVGLVAHGAEE